MALPSPLVSVAQAVELCNACFEGISFQVEGEISGYSESRGKFIFFDLKDAEVEAKLSCFMMLYQRTMPLEDGMRVVATARPSIYAKSGQFRLIISRVEPKGEGSLKRAFVLLKQKLEQEGLFTQGRKRALPTYPQHIGILSSATAAGFGDFMRIARQRFPGIRYTLANVAVQGNDAERELIAGLQYLNSVVQPEVIVVIRGGGSLEDLQAFNSEPLARAIAASRAPVVVGVGHERDESIADYVADVRAATPSNAAEIVVPSKVALEDSLAHRLARLDANLHRNLTMLRQRLLRSAERRQSLVMREIERYRQLAKQMQATIAALAPSNVLARGYAIVSRTDGTSVRHGAELAAREVLSVRFSDTKRAVTVNS